MGKLLHLLVQLAQQVVQFFGRVTMGAKRQDHPEIVIGFPFDSLQLAIEEKIFH